MNGDNRKYGYSENQQGMPEKQKQRSYPSYVLISLASGLVGALIFAVIFGGKGVRTGFEEKIIKPQTKSVTIETSDESNIPEAVAEKTMGSVVGITSKQIRERNDFFFGPMQQLIEGVGSGIIVSSDGYIVTNSHVIANGKAEELNVLFIDGSEKEASVVWYDDTLDLAVIKVDAENLAPAELGDSDKIKIGETAVAIGNPLGLEFERTVTAGIVSGLNRTLQVSAESNMEGLIQTDASINSGNSGGPLLNKEGKVIGINTLKIQSVEGMGFAQPINLVKPVIDQITATGTFDDAYIGIIGEDAMRYQKAKGADLGIEYGTLITAVQKDSPADKAELKPGDVITSINGDKVESFQGLRKLLYKYKPGESVVLGIVRDKQSTDINVTLAGLAEFR